MRTWLNELIWRDFYQMILHQHPHVQTRAFQAQYDSLPYEHDRAHFAAWREARTVYPLVDAAMRQLHRTGYMHNHLRMVTASFLSKHLCVDWRWGERYFAEKLLDFELASNNGGWQWAASTGIDAQPWFRVFPEGRFIKRYLPELAAVPAPLVHTPWLASATEQRQWRVVIGADYPAPVVDHAAARARAGDVPGGGRWRGAPG